MSGGVDAGRFGGAVSAADMIHRLWDVLLGVTMSGRRIYSIATLGFTAAAVFSVWLLAGWGGQTVIRAVDDLGLVGFAAFGSGCAALAAWHGHGRQRLAWIAMAVGLASWAIGESVWSYYELWQGRSPVPFPSPADAGFLLLPVGAATALMLLPTGHTASSRTRLVLDGFIVAGSFFVVSWVCVLKSVYQTSGISAFALGVSIAYPVADIVILTVAVLVLSRDRGPQRLTLVLTTTGIVLIGLADSGFVYLTAHNDYVSGDVIDLAWMGGLLVLGCAALASIGEPHADPVITRSPARLRSWLPYLPMAVAGGIALWQIAPDILRGGAVPPVVLALVIAVLVRQFVVVREDRRLLVTVAEQALRDPLTGLANRVLFLDRLGHAFALHQRDPRPVAIVSVDLDDFKLINDSLGHAAGDSLLARVGERLLGAVRAADTVARLGGDEFVILIEDGSGHPGAIAHRVAESFDTPFLIEGIDLRIRPSIGLAVLPVDDIDTSPERLLKQADIAMYSAKRAGDGRVHTFTPDMPLTQQVLPPTLGSRTNGSRRPDRGGPPAGTATTARPDTPAAVLSRQLRDAIDHRRLLVHYQPTIALRSGELVGVEALVRWPHPQRGLLYPAEFLDLVCDHGLTGPLTEFVLDTAIADAVAWKARGHSTPITVNLFGTELRDHDLPARIARTLARHGLPATELTVDITADQLRTDRVAVVDMLKSLRGLGVRIAIDDVGANTTALPGLGDLPVDEVKLDRALIASIAEDRDAAAIAASIVGLARKLGLATVAVGVETAAAATILTGYGCAAAQGHLYGIAVSNDQILELITR